MKHGHSYTSYPDGATQYYGEYVNDTMVGEWKIYNRKGESQIKNYGTIEEIRNK